MGAKKGAKTVHQSREGSKMQSTERQSVCRAIKSHVNTTFI